MKRMTRSSVQCFQTGLPSFSSFCSAYTPQHCDCTLSALMSADNEIRDG